MSHNPETTLWSPPPKELQARVLGLTHLVTMWENADRCRVDAGTPSTKVREKQNQIAPLADDIRRESCQLLSRIFNNWVKLLHLRNPRLLQGLLDCHRALEELLHCTRRDPSSTSIESYTIPRANPHECQRASLTTTPTADRSQVDRESRHLLLALHYLSWSRPSCACPGQCLLCRKANQTTCTPRGFHTSSLARPFIQPTLRQDPRK